MSNITYVSPGYYSLNQWLTGELWGESAHSQFSKNTTDLHAYCTELSDPLTGSILGVSGSKGKRTLIAKGKFIPSNSLSAISTINLIRIKKAKSMKKNLSPE